MSERTVNTPNIKSFQRVVPMIYAYQTPGVSYHDGWTKIGYTEKQDVEARINQQTHTAGIRWELCWQDNAMYKDGSGQYFTDHEFHDYLEGEKKIPREQGTEWFQIDGDNSQVLFNKFASRKTEKLDEGCTYQLREEQQRAVEKTKAYFENGGTEFLWNAKPRFGKTLTAYDLAVQMGFKNILIVTNRPSIANSWYDDFRKFIGWQYGYLFVSENDVLKGKPGVLSRSEYLDRLLSENGKDVNGMVAFESLQGLKGSIYFGGNFDKLEWLAKDAGNKQGYKQQGTKFDLLIIDESHEGVDTIKTERALRNIDRKHTLYLSGTPFKALASAQFNKEQIFNWSYSDEQEAKESWNSLDYNPYEQLPRLALYTYQLSPMIRETVQKGLDLSEENGVVDYAFDLNEFFATNESGKFIHEDEVKKFLHALSTQEKYPYSTPELRKELSHTLWLLNRVASAKALAKLLKEDPVFSEYEIIIAAGDGRLDDDVVENDKAYDRVKKAIAEHDRTITLSVGQLTVGVTIPEWSGVLMLCNMQSPAAYMQAAFRAQNPCVRTIDGQRFRKETAYIFDFDPARTLVIFDEFANNLSSDAVSGRGTAKEHEENIKKLLNFFPVLGEDEEGKMVELDAAQVLSIPRRIKSVEVVRHGFMSNFLFQNIGVVFSAPNAVKEILNKVTPVKEEKKRKGVDPLDHVSNMPVDQNGNVEIPNSIVIGKEQEIFGDKIYENLTDIMTPVLNNLAETGPDYETSVKKVDQLKGTLKESLKNNVIEPAVDIYDVTKGIQNRIEKEFSSEIDRKFDQITGDYEQQVKIAKASHEKNLFEAESKKEIWAADEGLKADMEAAMNAFVESVNSEIDNIINNKPQEIIEKLERNKAEKEKRTIEDDVRARLRGFCRTIPSFIMAYGDENLTLNNFDDYTEDDVFAEVTGITEEDFRFLRDGGDYIDSETGKVEHFAGHIFDETVFNDSIAEFLKKKRELANYFDESKDEDIFDYIPPQKNNQIFTPRWVVQKMVDTLEEENPGCFDDPDNTFADLYMKSGLYITEIVKRLYRSERMKELIPDDDERIRHILRNQVYGMAPTRIIYLIATNYILGFDETLKEETKNFAQADALEASKNGRLQELVDECFG